MDDFDFETLLQEAAYAPQDAENSYLEMWTYSGTSEPVKRDGPLLTKDVDNFLDSAGQHAVHPPPEGSELLGGCRLIIQRYNEVWSEGFFYPFTFDDEKMLLKFMRKLQFPRDFFGSWQMQNGASWSVEQVVDGDKCLHIVFNPGWSSGFWALAISYNYRTRISSAYLGIRGPVSLKNMNDRLKTAAGLSFHPIMIPIMVYSNYLFQVVSHIEGVRADLLGVEKAIGLNTNPGGTIYGATPDWIMGKDDYTRLNETIVSVHGTLSTRELEFLQRASVTIHKALGLFEPQLKLLPKVDNTQHESLKTRMEILDQHLEMQVLLTKIFYGKITMYTSVLYNLMAQRDNKLNISVAADSRRIASASKRDSSAMKTIAVLTIVFLPGTFVSAIFSTSIFDFRASGRPTMSHNFWIYWVITIPLTILTMGIWTAWYYWNNQKQARQDRDLERSMKPESPDGAQEPINRVVVDGNAWRDCARLRFW